MILNQAVFTDQTLMLLAKLGSNLVRMTVAKYQRYWDVFFNLFSSMLVSAKLDWFVNAFLLTMIRVTKRAIELTFDDKFLALTVHHQCFHAITARSFSTAN